MLRHRAHRTRRNCLTGFQLTQDYLLNESSSLTYYNTVEKLHFLKKILINFLEMFSNKAITEPLHSCRFTECTQQKCAYAHFPAVWVRDMSYLCGLHFQHWLFSHILLIQSNQPVIISSHHLWPWTRRAVKKTKGSDMQIHDRFTFDPFIMVWIDFVRIWIKSCLNH